MKVKIKNKRARQPRAQDNPWSGYYDAPWSDDHRRLRGTL